MNQNKDLNTKKTERHGSPTFYRLLDEMGETHDKKSHDYAPDGNPYANYEFAGYVASLFSHSPIDTGFAGRIAEKIMRLSVLEKRGSPPQNESVADTERDIAVIATLWMASRRDRALSNQSYEAIPGEVKTVSPPKIGLPFHQAMTLLGVMNQTEIEELRIYLTNVKTNPESRVSEERIKSRR